MGSSSLDAHPFPRPLSKCIHRLDGLAHFRLPFSSPLESPIHATRRLGSVGPLTVDVSRLSGVSINASRANVDHLTTCHWSNPNTLLLRVTPTRQALRRADSERESTARLVSPARAFLGVFASLGKPSFFFSLFLV